ncbi:transmembrane protein 221 [Ahaetulla prasina]|uniref:transmembrane protein 221 n=1 Tax=Ahaetulla prasina TaxID=499056 RepID=UPI0026473318|nr:transmembrane protein 221 [Ahaetulla prasina]
MLSQYGHRALGALMLLGTASGLVAVLASMLLFQIQGGTDGNRDLPQRLRALLRPISAGLASLGLVLSLSCLLLSLLHGYCGAERCAASGGALGSERCVCEGVPACSLLPGSPEATEGPLFKTIGGLGGPGSQHSDLSTLQTNNNNILFLCHRGDWFLLESRKVRHVAVGVFCCAVLAYLAASTDVNSVIFPPALSIYVTMAFERETGITCACILSSGIVVLIITVIHALVRASRQSPGELSHNLYENDSAQSVETPAVVPPTDGPKVASSHSHLEIHPEVSYLSYVEQKSHQTTPASSTNVTSVDSVALNLEKEGCGIPRMHRTLSVESGLLLSHGVRQEMRTILSRKPARSGKDSTLV